MPVTQTPVLLNSSGLAPNYLNSLGPYEGSSPAIIYQAVRGASAFNVMMLKSIDSGVTWTRLDQANEPTANPVSCVRVGNILYFGLVQLVTLKIYIKSFNISTDTWSADGTLGHALTAFQQQVFVRRLSNGDFWIFYSRNITVGINPAYKAIFYAVNSGGVWGAETDLLNISTDDNIARNVLLDTAGTTFYIIYSNNATTVGSGFRLRYLKITTGGVITVPGTNIVTGRGSAEMNKSAPVSIWNDGTNDVLVLPLKQTSSSFSSLGVWIGSPASNPTWTFTLIDTVTHAAGAFDDTWFSFIGGSSVYVWWSIQDSDPGEGTQKLYYSVNDGTGWSTPVLYYDAFALPPVPGPANPTQDQFIHDVSGILLSNGLFAIVAGLESNIACRAYYLLDGSCNIQITANAAVVPAGSPYVLPNATVGVIYSIPLQATEGGSVHFEYSFTSGNTPSGVSLGGITNSSSPPVISDTGLTLGGTPAPIGNTPVTYEFTGKMKLTQ